ncbi:MAG TPA: hypothetical protein VFS30_12990 [Dehalococcoidia bacterium]|nr:hypothetical protein [Dehalococcoidia bacterium]
MANVYLSQDLLQVWRLKELMGSANVEHLDETHPLRLCFDAAQKDLMGLASLTAEERERLAYLKLSARAIFSNEAHWKPFEERFIADLRQTEECKSLLFELQVMTFGVGPNVQAMKWRHYANAAPDIEASVPDMLVECKLVRSDKLFRIEGKLEEGRRQHGGLDVPYVIAVGFDHYFSRAEIEDALALANDLKPWFLAHPDVAAGLIFMPADPCTASAQPVHNPLGLVGTVALHGGITELIHHKATHPLPAGFSFNPSA